MKKKEQVETDEQRKERETRHAIEVIVAYLKFSRPMTKTELDAWCRKNTDPVFNGWNSWTIKKSSTYGIKKPCNIAFDLILQNPLAYGVMVHEEKLANGKVVTTYGGEIPSELLEKGKSNEFAIVGKSIFRAWDRAAKNSNGNATDFKNQFYTELEEERRLMETLGITKEVFWYQFGIMINTLELSPSQMRKCERDIKREARTRHVASKAARTVTGTRQPSGQATSRPRRANAPRGK